MDAAARDASDVAGLDFEMPEALEAFEPSEFEASVLELSVFGPSVLDLSALELSELELSLLDPLRAAAFVWLLARRSFLAQPEPLKCTAGEESSLRIAPPHVAHASGPWPLTPWTTSTTRPQTVQA